jgi:glc operon protein GlcG
MSSFKFPKAVSALVMCVACVAAMAQSPAPNPLDNIPEKMPNDIPYGVPISLDRAEAVLNAALAESKNRNWKLICAVYDSGANLVSFKRMDGAQLGSIDIAKHKARASVKLRRETKALEAGIQNGNHYLITLDDVIASRGGIPLIEGGKMIGAIGCSGGTGSQDEVAAKAGVAALK